MKTIGPPTLTRPRTIWCSVIAWRKDWVRVAAVLVRVSAATAAAAVEEARLVGKMLWPMEETTKAAPAATTAPMMPPPTAAEAMPPASTATRGTAAGISQSSRRWCRW